MPVITSSRLRFGTAILPVLLIFGAAGPVAAGDPDNPTYTAVVSPSGVPAGKTTTTTLTISAIEPFNDSLGSLRATAPAGLTVTGATAKLGGTAVTATVSGSSVTVDDLRITQVGQVLTLAIATSTACGVSGARSWTVDGRTSRAYSDGDGRSISPAAGSSLAISIVPCSLEFVRQPALAGSDSVITSVAADPTGAPVAVRLLDGSGAPSASAGVAISLGIASGTGSTAAAIGGTTSDTTNANGVASFAPMIDLAATGYRLRATASGITGVTSASFDIAGVARLCNGSCGATESKSATTATVDATTSGGLLSLSVGVGSVDCNNAANGFYVATSEALLFDVTQATGRTVVTVMLARDAVDRKTRAYQVCFSSPVSSFKNRAGATVTAGNAGLLPDCWPDAAKPKKPLPVSYQACLEKRWKDSAGNVYVRFSVPPGDPRAKI